ncbi:hypothetical protein [Methanosarcina horonobensis]|uniref:hypothetical protein n=1 Tax=Methanosarcina horonobensis TaxID=418008 RepID=UPI0022B91A18|nr:hypothetical protein [Methanosarcina horonobensis]
MLPAPLEIKTAASSVFMVPVLYFVRSRSTYGTHNQKKCNLSPMKAPGEHQVNFIVSSALVISIPTSGSQLYQPCL